MTKSNAEYQKAYRERKKAENQPKTLIVGEDGPEVVTPKNSGQLARDRVPGSKLLNPYTDGLPDWGELIQNLSQHQRDAILEKINKSGSKNR